MGRVVQGREDGDLDSHSLLKYITFFSHVNRNLEPKSRKCLKCGVEFSSKHCGNRLCVNCFNRNGQMRSRNLQV